MQLKSNELPTESDGERDKIPQIDWLLKRDASLTLIEIRR